MQSPGGVCSGYKADDYRARIRLDPDGTSQLDAAIPQGGSDAIRSGMTGRYPVTLHHPIRAVIVEKSKLTDCYFKLVFHCLIHRHWQATQKDWADLVIASEGTEQDVRP